MPVNQVVAGTQVAIGKPRHVTMFERSGRNCSEIFMPSNEVSSKCSPEFIGVLNRVLVHLLILLQSMNMRNGVVIKEFWVIKLFRIGGFYDDLFRGQKFTNLE